MASIKVFLILLTLTALFSQSNGQICLTTDNRLCVFPFIYGEQSYNGCTAADNNGVFWCATDLYSTGFAKGYGNCKTSCRHEETHAPPQCKTTSGRDCILPFRYNNVEYSDCTLAGDTNPWCATETYSGTNETLFWEYCNSVCNVAATADPAACHTLENQKCIFPFKYYGVTYNACTGVDNGGTLWCATTLNSDGEAVGWGNCKSSC
ncbi:72 kDa type IV collagenase [Lepeophtheirus salmonis]|uniref:72 kDa type IV collagenase n=1 Tax=Lepeophtheirus salmonis TaxID=72036 RepID=UPI001AE8330E|nr:matrix metalloproteinase-9-like [Lepeophtheirus salmonis]